MKRIDGGVCAAGYKANGISAQIKNATKLDLALIYSDKPCQTAAVFTRNIVKAAPVLVSMEHMKKNNGNVRAIIVNSGNANACAVNGIENANKMTDLVSEKLNIPKEEVLVASTGIIGVELPIGKIVNNIDKLVEGLDEKNSGKAAEAIMTTDTFKKEAAMSFDVNGKTYNIGGITKGSGMINPNMGTTLSFITTDMNISTDLLNKVLKECTDRTINQISVDNDTSTNDMVVLMSKSDGEKFGENSEEFKIFKNVLLEIMTIFAKDLARDGEGATKLIECVVVNADENAKQLSKAVISSALVKAAMFGNDPNWGRVLCALGYSGATFKENKVSVTFKSETGSVTVCDKGLGVEFDENLAKKVLDNKEVRILVDMNDGSDAAAAWGCDLTYDYVKINGDYRS